MKTLFTIENKTFRVSMVDDIESKKFVVKLSTENGGEFTVKFTDYNKANEFFEVLTHGLYQYEN